ncbi:MAG: cupin domain-containing protein [Clostridia bacterium]|nr:cupin domain-containing protein [Clostridia bacterium]
MAVKHAEIAERLQAIRELSDLTPAQLAERISMDEKEYLAYESGTKDIPVSVLSKVCNALEVGMTELLTGDAPKLHNYSFVKKGKGLEVDRNIGYKHYNLAFKFANRKIEPLLVIVDPEEGEEMHLNSHQGQEYHYCLEGRFLFQLQDHQMVVEPGDSVYFDSHYPHGMMALDGKPAKILVIVI